MSRRFRAWWWTALTCALAGGYLVIAVASPSPSIRWPALAGAVLVLAGLRVAARFRRAAIVPVALGALVPVVTAWWSVAIPLTAGLIIVCGTLAVRRADERTPTAGQRLIVRPAP